MTAVVPPGHGEDRLDPPGQVFGERVRPEQRVPSRATVEVTRGRVQPSQDVGPMAMPRADGSEATEYRVGHDPARRLRVAQIGSEAGVRPVLRIPHQAGIDRVEMDVTADRHQMTPEGHRDRVGRAAPRESRSPLEVGQTLGQPLGLGSNEEMIVARQNAIRVQIDRVPRADLADRREEGSPVGSSLEPVHAIRHSVHGVSPSRVGRGG